MKQTKSDNIVLTARQLVLTPCIESVNFRRQGDRDTVYTLHQIRPCLVGPQPSLCIVLLLDPSPPRAALVSSHLPVKFTVGQITKQEWQTKIREIWTVCCAWGCLYTLHVHSRCNTVNTIKLKGTWKFVLPVASSLCFMLPAAVCVSRCIQSKKEKKISRLGQETHLGLSSIFCYLQCSCYLWLHSCIIIIIIIILIIITNIQGDVVAQ